MSISPWAGNRKGLGKQIRNILIVWLLTGIWHGAGWNFVVWGLYFGVILMMEKIGLLRLLEKAPGFLRHLYTMLLVASCGLFLPSIPWGRACSSSAPFRRRRPSVGRAGVYLLYSSAVLLVLLILGSTGLPEKPPPWQAGSSGPSCRIYRGGARPYPGGLRALCGLSGGRIL